MLNIFPDLLAWGLLAPFLLRVTLGLVFLADSARKLRGKTPEGIHMEKGQARIIGTVEGITGLMLIIGLYTQIAALAALAVALFAFSKKRSPLFLVLAVIALSLTVSGAGAFAFDLPL